MTRETKIGLLVGLAFIIVIGILLSDHFTSATQPHQAALTTTIDGVLGSTRTLGPQHQSAGPLELPNVEPRSIPVQPDPTLERRQHVEVGGANRGQRIIDVTEQPIIPNEPIITQIPDVDRGHGGINEIIARVNELPVIIAPAAPEHPAAAAPVTNMKSYVAEGGDTLGKIASKAMGANTKANRDLIVKANPSLQVNPNKVVMGDSYNIPVQTAAAVTPKSEPKETVAAAPVPVASNSVEYVVKEGDRLSKIAREQCGSITFVAQILEMNKDVLKGDPDKLKINMKLKLPPKQVASR
jgi:LysM repeat protein